MFPQQRHGCSSSETADQTVHFQLPCRTKQRVKFAFVVLRTAIVLRFQQMLQMMLMCKHVPEPSGKHAVVEPVPGEPFIDGPPGRGIQEGEAPARPLPRRVPFGTRGLAPECQPQTEFHRITRARPLAGFSACWKRSQAAVFGFRVGDLKFLAAARCNGHVFNIALLNEGPPMTLRKLEEKPRAYAVLAGGGVKGAALAGAIVAAQKHFAIEGYGGTSAGSVVAMLAAIGTDARRLESEVTNTPFTQFVDDGGIELKKLRDAFSRFETHVTSATATWTAARWYTPWKYLPLRSHVGGLKSIYDQLQATLWNSLGLYEGRHLTDYVLNQIRSRYQQFAASQDISFEELELAGATPLKIVSADSTNQRPVLFSRQDRHYGTSVVDAVRASASYPIVYRPHERNNRRLVDGGLASNLPAFLFRRESLKTGFPTLAFDLINPEPDGAAPADPHSRSLKDYLLDLLGTALDSSDVLLRDSVDSVIYIPIELPRRLSAVDFEISRADRVSLFNAGYRCVDEFLTAYLKRIRAADSPTMLQATEALRIVEDELRANPENSELRDEFRRTRVRTMRLHLMKQYGDPNIFVAVLRSLAWDVEEFSGAENVRAALMLPTGQVDDNGRPTMIIVYEFGFTTDDGTEDSDLRLELSQGTGASGRVWETAASVLVDLELAPTQKSWHMTPEQHAMIPEDRKSLLTWPVTRQLPDLPKHAESHEDGTDREQSVAVIATLNVDSTTPLADNHWRSSDHDGLDEGMQFLLQTWAQVLSRILP